MGIEQLKKFRESEDLTQQEAAAKVGVAREMWACWETGARKISPSKLPLVAEITKIPKRVLRPDLAELLTDGAA
jgi:transcriptional regulator with XRE-family HTH domain